MSKPKGARLWLQPAQRTANGIRPAFWVIRDGARKISTGCAEGDRAAAEQELAAYIIRSYKAEVSREQDPEKIFVAEVLNLYLENIVDKHARPKETAARILRLNDFMGARTLAEVNGELCRTYAEWRGADAAARRELEDLRSAIRHFKAEGRTWAEIIVTLPEKGEGRVRWLERHEAARLIWAAWRLRQSYKGIRTGRPVAKHVAKFILVGLYTGSRAGDICGAALRPTPGYGWVDLRAGVFYRKPDEKAETKKRQPPVPLPDRLLHHLRRWARTPVRYSDGSERLPQFVVEWVGQPVDRVHKAWRSVREKAGLGENVTPHVLRHTAATWLKQQGVPSGLVGQYLGMTEDMVERVYGHHDPNYLEQARRAIAQKGQRRNVANL